MLPLPSPWWRHWRWPPAARSSIPPRSRPAPGAARRSAAPATWSSPVIPPFPALRPTVRLLGRPTRWSSPATAPRRRRASATPPGRRPRVAARARAAPRPPTRPRGRPGAPGEPGTPRSCDGFDDDQPGVTSSTITVANVSDISGPVPGIFESARQGTKAYLAYFNATQKLCGRRLELLELDSRADAGADQQAYARACTETFAAVGSMSAFDSGGAATAAEVRPAGHALHRGQPRAHEVLHLLLRRSPSRPGSCRARCPTTSPASTRTRPSTPRCSTSTPVRRWSTPHRSRRAGRPQGWKVDYFQAIDVSEFNFAPYVQQMKDKGIKLVYYVGPYQNTIKLQQAMKQQGFDPEYYLQDSTIYDAKYAEQAGDLPRAPTPTPTSRCSTTAAMRRCSSTAPTSSR